jgi:hypothetical protein
MRAFLKLSLFLSPLFSAAAWASTAIPCYFCSTAQMYDSARAAGTGYHLVLDVPGGVVMYYNVYCGEPNRPQPAGAKRVPTLPNGMTLKYKGDYCPVLSAEEVELPAAYHQAALALRDIYVESGGTMKVIREVAAGDISQSIANYRGEQVASNWAARTTVRNALGH